MDFTTFNLELEEEEDSILIEEVSGRDIAIIGMSVDFAEADTIEKFWYNIRNGKDCITDFPEGRRKDTDQYLYHTGVEKEDIKYSNGAYLREIDKFDCKFFNLSPKEASLMSPNQRLFLENVWKTIEDAGYGGSRIVGSRTGVYIGFEADEPYDYKRFIAELDPSAGGLAVTGNLTPIIASRISYLLDLRGPSLSLDTACSSSLVAVHTACQALRNGECDLAIAGSVKVNLLPVDKHLNLGTLSSDGKTKTFDDSSDGTGSGEGVASILIKPLSKAKRDGDHIYAVIKGTSVNQDGKSLGITAPNAIAQEDVIVNAWKDADIDPETISYIEAHGTGTELGDPIEIEGIRRAFRRYTTKKKFCAIGSVKTNMGHLDNAAGIAGLIKSVLSLKHKEIPPSLHFKRPNRRINFIDSPVYVNDVLTPWETDGFPRRCGISSFGFSGTNCHVVLEEFNPQTNDDKNYGDNHREEKGYEIFTLSAKSKKSLKNLILKYNSFVENEENLDLQNICYTANTGRGHYAYRIVMIQRNIEEFKDNLRKVKEIDLNTLSEDRLFYGYHRVVPFNKEFKEENELTENQVKELSNKIDGKIQLFIKSENNDEKLAMEMCRLYTKGADVDWETLYRDDNRMKARLPVYQFDQDRYWVEVNNQKRKNINYGKKTTRTLLDRCKVEFMDLKIYSSSISADDCWSLSRHRGNENYMLGSSTYVEMVLEAAKEYYKDRVVELKGVKFGSPLIMLLDEQRDIEILMENKGDYSRFTVAGKSEIDGIKEDGKWTKYFDGKALPLKEDSNIHYDLNKIMSRCTESINIIDIDTNFQIGSKGNYIRELFMGEEELLAHAMIPDEFVHELNQYELYPWILDHELLFLPLIQKYDIDRLTEQKKGGFIPVSWDTMRVYDSTPEEFYIHVKLNQNIAKDSKCIPLDVRLIDPNGKAFVEVDGYVLRLVEDWNLMLEETSDESLYYQVGWMKQELKKGGNHKVGSILVMKNSSEHGGEFVEDLRNAGREVIEVEIANGYKKISGNKYTVKPDIDCIKKLLNDIPLEELTQIIHLSAIANTQGIETINDLDESQDKGIRMVFNLLKALTDVNADKKLEIILVAGYINEITGQEEILKPENATLCGMGKVINHEYAKLKCRCIDIDTKTSLRDVIREIDGGGEVYQVAYRDGERYIEVFNEVDFYQIPEEELIIKEQGVYIITGGTGGIGLEMAKYLVSKGKVNIALISRNGMPPSNEWDDILNRNEDLNLCNKIKRIRALEKSGCTIECHGANVAIYEEVEAVINILKSKYGTINGIIHSAGLPGEGLIINKVETNFKEILAPKVRGTWILDRLTQNDHLDFFVMCSSITTLTGAPGEGDYTAANLFLDAYSAYRNRKGQKTLTINWPAWKETGMAVRYGVNVDGVFKAITNDTALKAFDNVLSKNIGRVFIGEINYQNEVFNDISNTPVKLSDQIIETIYRKANPSKTTNDKISKLNTIQGISDIQLNKIQLKGRKHDNYSETERLVATAFGTFLGSTEIDIFDSFYELGGDSLIGMKVINMINKALGIKTNVIDLFKHSNVKEFAAYLDGSQMNKNIYSSIKKSEKKDYYPLSSAQRRLFILYHSGDVNTSYNLPLFIGLEGKIEEKRFENIFKKLIERHETLRTSFDVIDGYPVQRIHDKIDFEMTYGTIDKYILDETMKDESLEAIMKRISQDFIKPFDISKAPLLRVGLISLSEEKHFLMFDMHHIISDGVSMDILVKEFVAMYDGHSLPDLKIQYKDFSQWQNALFNSEEIKEQETYWLNTFSGEIPVLNMPLDYTRPSIQSFEGESIKFEIDKKLLQGLNKIALETDTTLNMVLLTAYNILLSKYTGQEDIIVGLPIAGRSHGDLENIIGMFVNTIALRNYPKGTKTVKEFIGEVRENALSAYANQDYQFEELVEKLDVKRDLSRNPLFDIMFVLQNMDVGEARVTGLKLTPYKYDNKISRFDITLYAVELDEGVGFTLEYCTKLFKRKTMENFSENFINILEQITERTELKLCEVNSLSEEETHKLLVEFNNTTNDFTRNKAVHQIFEEQVEKGALDIAVVFDESKLTYKELNERANKIGRYIRKNGINAEDTVAIMLERTPLMVESILGVWKAKGAYIPIDPDYPLERVAVILEDSKTKVLITESKCVSPQLEDEYKGLIIKLDLLEKELAQEEGDNLNLPIDTSNLAYVIYTSGSTGKPKGAMVEHIGMMNHMMAKVRELQLNSDSIIVQNASQCFDISVWQFFSALICGGKTVIYNNDIVMNPKALIGRVIEDEVTILEVVPSFLDVMLNYLEENKEVFEKLQYLIVTGEEVKAKLVKRWFDCYPEIKMVNAYGPTEASDDITHFIMDRCPDLSRIPIGKPIQNFKIYIVDKYMKLCPMGVVGEIMVAGIGVGRGYLNDEEKTRKVFLDDPFEMETTVRAYKTGDLGKWHPDGTIEFLGRKDYQVKIRGFRLELGEIESKLIDCNNIKKAVVIDIDDDKGEKYLCAYVVAVEKIDTVRIKEELKNTLPHYMIPSYFIQLDEIPLTSNGKVDRKALPNPKIEVDTGAAYVAPRNAVEEKLVEIWKEVLGVEKIGIKDAFFDIGGHSLKATLIVARITKEFKVNIKLRKMLQNPTIMELGEDISACGSEDYTPIERVEKRKFYPVSAAHKRLFILQKLDPDNVSFNITGVKKVVGKLDRNRVEMVVNQIIKRHEALRTTFEIIDGEIVQKVHDDLKFKLDYSQAYETEIEEIINRFIKPFDLAEMPLLRVKIIKIEAESYLLLFDMHHIISDGMSMDILIKEFTKLYSNEILPELKVQYKDFSVWQQKFYNTEALRRQEEYWLKVFEKEIKSLNIPLDYPRPAMMSFEGDSVHFELDETTTTHLNQLSLEHNTTLYMILLSAYNILLHKYSGQDDLIVGTPVSGRNIAEFNDVIGMFINTVAIRNYPSPKKNFLEFMNEVKENAVSAFENSDYQIEVLEKKLHITKAKNRNAIFDTIFVFQNTHNPLGEVSIDGLKFITHQRPNSVSKLDLHLAAFESENQIKFMLDYCTKLFKTETIVRMAEHFVVIIQQVIDNPMISISEIDIFTPEEKERYLNQYGIKLTHENMEDIAVTEEIDVEFDF